MTCTTDSRSQYAHPGRADVEWPVVRAVVDDFQQQLKKQHEDTALKAKLTAEEERAVTFVLAHLKPEATQAPRDKHKAKKAGQRAPFGAVTAEERSAEQRKHVAERKQMHVLWATNPTALCSPAGRLLQRSPERQPGGHVVCRVRPLAPVICLHTIHKGE